MQPEKSKKDLIKSLTEEYAILLNRAIELDEQQIENQRLVRINNQSLSKCREALNEIRQNI